MGLLYAAAVRARLTIIGESQEKLDEAIAIANERLSDMTTNTERFLVLETTGRQLAYAGRDEDALTWMDRAIQLNIEEYGIFRRNVLITAGEVVAKSNPKGAVAYTTAAVEVARTAILGRVHLAEALAEHSLALWNAGNREESFAAWDEGVETLLAARDQKPWWTKAFLAFLQTAGYFSGMSLWGKITDPNFAIPKPGFFLALDNMPVERYQPIQDGLLLLRTAMFAEGVVNTSAAAKWAVRAYAEARKQPGTDLMDSFAWLPIPHWIETGAYDQAIEYAFTLSKKKRADEASLDAFALTGQDRKRAEEFFAEPKVVDRTFLFFLVPIALHLAAVRFDRDITKELATITNKMESLSAESDDPWKEAAHFLSSIFSGETSWKDWHDEIGPLYSSGRLAFGLLASLASVLEAPLKQSLVSQIGLARNLEQVFKISPSIRGTFVAPFFTRYWQDAVATRSELFRTPYAVTQKAHSEAAALPIGVRVKGLLAKMVFCTNLNLSDMSEELRTWIEEAS